MATKTKARKSTVDHAAELQEAIRQVGIAQSRLAAYLIPPEGPTSCLLQAKTALSQAASHLLRLLKAQERGRSPHRRKGAKPVKRGNVDGGMPKRPSVDSRQSEARIRKRVARKQAVEVPRAGKKNIHYLKHGLCVCGMFSSPPVNWPYDHQWAPDWKDVNCPGCLSRKPSGKEFFHGQDIPH